jgi:tetratricopeptide (TPR) repeat protein
LIGAQWLCCSTFAPKSHPSRQKVLTLRANYHHALLCATWIEQEQMTFPEAARLLNQAGYYLNERARYVEAEPLYQRALAICEQQLGPDHPDTATSLNNLAGLYQDQGKYEQAEPLFQRALSIKEQQLGPEHPSTANSLNNLAGLYRAQGKYEQAEPLYVRALAIREQQLGTEHPDTAGSLNNLAALYYSQGKYAEAEPLLKHALEIYEQQLGETHPTTITMRENYATLLRDTQQAAVIATLPPAIREALGQGDATSLQQALEALPTQEQQTIIDLLRTFMGE